jgi:hypothetical protein
MVAEDQGVAAESTTRTAARSDASESVEERVDAPVGDTSPATQSEPVPQQQRQSAVRDTEQTGQPMPESELQPVATTDGDTEPTGEVATRDDAPEAREAPELEAPAIATADTHRQPAVTQEETFESTVEETVDAAETQADGVEAEHASPEQTMATRDTEVAAGWKMEPVELPPELELVETRPEAVSNVQETDVQEEQPARRVRKPHHEVEEPVRDEPLVQIETAASQPANTADNR